MTIDGYLLLAPVLLVPIIFLIRLVGCQYIAPFDIDALREAHEDGDLEEPSCASSGDERSRPVDFRIRFYPDSGLSRCADYTAEVEMTRTDGSDSRLIRTPPTAPAGINLCEVQPREDGERWYYRFFKCFAPGEYYVTCRYWRSDAGRDTAEETTTRAETLTVDGGNIVLAQQPAAGEQLVFFECFDWTR